MSSMTDPGDSMHLRSKKVMDHYGFQQHAFANKLGVSPATISSIYNGRTKPTNNLVQAIHREFPEINTNWLLFEEGEMCLSSTVFSQSSVEDGVIQNVVSSDATVTSPFPASGGEIPMFFADETVQTTPSSQSVQAQTVRPAAVHRTSNRSTPRTTDTVYHNNANVFDKQPRRVKEIRVFYDDGTIEVFAPASK